MFLKNFEDLQNTGSHRRYSMVLILFAQVMNLRGGLGLWKCVLTLRG